MENNPSKLCFNSNQTGLNNPAFDAGSHPLAPDIEVSAGVRQVGAATSPFSDGVQDLLSLNPKKRLQAIFVSTRQDDYFCGLAQNRQLDGQSRLAATIKIKDNEKRDAALAELAKDVSLSDKSRLKAADKMVQPAKKQAVFNQLAGDESLDKLSRLEASLFTESRIELEAQNR